MSEFIYCAEIATKERLFTINRDIAEKRVSQYGGKIYKLDSLKLDKYLKSKKYNTYKEYKQIIEELDLNDFKF